MVVVAGQAFGFSLKSRFMPQREGEREGREGSSAENFKNSVH